MATPRTVKPTRLPKTTRYEFHEPIGSGGAGTVYRARDTQTDQWVAVKVLKSRPRENPILHQRLAVEFKAATALEHPNIVRALAADTDGEVSYVVYELVEAAALGDRLDAHGRLTEDAAVRIITQIAQALHYAHERQVVHRDVKPDNILVFSDGRAKLTDFGLAKDFTDNQNLTCNAAGLGTPNFMAPEQFADAKNADARCDVYSLAATLYNAVTGKMPFHGKSPLVILASKQTGRLTPPAALVPGLSDRVNDAILAALQPNPVHRPPTCLEFFRLLTARPALTDTPAPLPMPPARDTDRRQQARYRMGVGSVAVVSPDVHGIREERWPMTLSDLSFGGVGLLLARRFEPGTELTVELAMVGDAPARLPARVVRVREDGAGHWFHGCEFDRPLDPASLRALLKHA